MRQQSSSCRTIRAIADIEKPPPLTTIRGCRRDNTSKGSFPETAKAPKPPRVWGSNSQDSLSSCSVPWSARLVDQIEDARNGATSILSRRYQKQILGGLGALAVHPKDAVRRKTGSQSHKAGSPRRTRSCHRSISTPPGPRLKA
jgi:hypothetical protein